jgi:four helix bundle protein
MEDAVLKLEIYRLAHDLSARIHSMTLTLPSFERSEEGSQIRRSVKRISASIIEGHTQRRHKPLYVSYLYRALASSDETQEHLLLLKDTGSLADAGTFESLSISCAELSRKLFRFIQAIERNYETPSYLSDLQMRPLEDESESE